MYSVLVKILSMQNVNRVHYSTSPFMLLYEQLLDIVILQDKGEMSVVKDTERADALKDMVQAWETEQPGRNKKAQESRNKFLATRAIKDDVDLSTDGVDGLPRPPTGPVKLLQMDFTPFYV